MSTPLPGVTILHILMKLLFGGTLVSYPVMPPQRHYTVARQYDYDCEENICARRKFTMSSTIMDNQRLLLTLFLCSFLFTDRGDKRSINFYQKLAAMHVTKIVRFEWSAVFKSFC